MIKKNIKIIVMLGIILLALILLLVGGDSKQEELLPTRDVEGLESYASTEEFCQDLTSAQEFDDFDREASFYETCLLQY